MVPKARKKTLFFSCNPQQHDTIRTKSKRYRDEAGGWKKGTRTLIASQGAVPPPHSQDQLVSPSVSPGKQKEYRRQGAKRGAAGCPQPARGPFMPVIALVPGGILPLLPLLPTCGTELAYQPPRPLSVVSLGLVASPCLSTFFNWLFLGLYARFSCRHVVQTRSTSLGSRKLTIVRH